MREHTPRAVAQEPGVQTAGLGTVNAPTEPGGSESQPRPRGENPESTPQVEAGFRSQAEHAGSEVDPSAVSEDWACFAGAPDGFERLWTPHRQAYISGGQSRPQTPAVCECPFCLAPAYPDAEKNIVYRGKYVYVLMNLFPYNSGHLLVCPYRHMPNYIDLDPAEREEFGEVTAQAVRVLGHVSGCKGFNLGMNNGQVAGAGIAGHLHQHVVPRWSGDSNFFPIIAQTKALPQLLGQAREQLASAWEKYRYEPYTLPEQGPAETPQQALARLGREEF